jgi:hypothetical protein
VEPGPDIEANQQQAHHGVARREREAAAVARDHPWDLYRDRRDRQRGRSLHQSVDQIVGVEAVCADREARPRLRHRDEQAGETSKHGA